MTKMKSKSTLALAALAAAGAIASIGLIGGSSAGADPKQAVAMTGFGSDTLQEVTNAFAGFASGVNYVPLQSGANQRQLVSWDATPDNQCIQTKPGTPSFHRPNGSTEGRYMLGIAAYGGSYQSTPCGNASVSGVIDFARTSSFVSTTTGQLTYVPLGRDATGFAYYAKPGVTPVTSLTQTQLNAIYTDGSLTVGSTRIIPCGIQLGSGTYQAWNTAVSGLGGSAGQNWANELTGVAECNAISTTTDDGNGRLQESKSGPLKDKGNAAPANTQVIVGFSAANFVSQMNGVAPGNPIADGVDLGVISNVTANKPYDVAGALYSPNNAYYSSTVFGRTIGYVLPTDLLTEPGENELKGMFTNGLAPGVPLAEICKPAAQATTNKFGFLSIASCGSTTIRGPLVTPSALPLS